MRPQHDLTVRDIAETFGKHANTAYRWLQAGVFPNAYKLPGAPERAEWRIPESDLDALRDRTAASPKYDAKKTRELLASARR